MSRKFVLTIFFLAVLIGTLGLSFAVQRVEASGTIYIRPDGSVDPHDAPVSTVDNATYTLTGNITSDVDGIVVERNNIVVDGAGYTLQGTGAYDSKGIDMTGRSNVTIKNTSIASFYYGIDLLSSSGNSIYGNVFVDDGLVVWSSYSSVVEDNLVNGKPLVYLEDTANLVVEDAGQVILVNCNNITISNLNLSHTTVGVQLCQSSNSTITNNNLSNNVLGVGLYSSSSGNSIIGNNITANNGTGIYLGSSSGNSISGNNITNNKHEGIDLYDCSNNTISGNNITANGWDGIDLNSSSNNSVSGNNVTNNSYDGILLMNLGGNNSISGNNIADNSIGIGLDSSSNNSIFGNNITNNEEGISLRTSSNNKVYYNNFINNPYHQASASDWINFWDDGYPSGGNCWSDYNGKDLYIGPYQNGAGSDGIGDTSYVIEANNTDHYPLVGMFQSYDVTYYTLPLVANSCCVTVISNSTISNFVTPIWIEHPEVILIEFNATGEQGTAGFCRVSFTTAMMNGTYHVFVNDTEIPYILLPCSNADYSYLFFTYTHSTEGVTIIPEVPSFLVLPLFMLFTMLVVVLIQRRIPRKRKMAGDVT